MPVFEDWLKDPLRIINNIYGKYFQKKIKSFLNFNFALIASDSPNFDLKVNEFFETKLKSEKNYYSVS